MDLSNLDILIQKKGAMICCKDLYPKRSAVQTKIPIKHIVSPGLDEELLDGLQQQIGDLPELISLYSKYGDIRLYIGEYADKCIGKPSAFYIAHPDVWNELKQSFLDWIEMEDNPSYFPEWVQKEEYVVFGEIPNSGNYFVVSTAGEDNGKIFEFEHDGFKFVERGNTMQAFIDWISEPNDELINYICGHTRYSDGTIDTQWLPYKYEYSYS